MTRGECWEDSHESVPDHWQPKHSRYSQHLWCPALALASSGVSKVLFPSLQRIGSTERCGICLQTPSRHPARARSSGMMVCKTQILECDQLRQIEMCQNVPRSREFEISLGG